MIADGLTKPLQGALFRKHRDLMLGHLTLVVYKMWSAGVCCAVWYYWWYYSSNGIIIQVTDYLSNGLIEDYKVVIYLKMEIY